jgi:hypothetical protein
MDKQKECVKNCEFSIFSNGKFTCSYYDKDLDYIKGEFGDIILIRCLDCIQEGIIGNNIDIENVRKLKKFLGWLADSFYSHKDEFETSLTEMYRILKRMEDAYCEKDNVFQAEDDKGYE